MHDYEKAKNEFFDSCGKRLQTLKDGIQNMDNKLHFTEELLKFEVFNAHTKSQSTEACMIFEEARKTEQFRNEQSEGEISALKDSNLRLRYRLEELRDYYQSIKVPDNDEMGVYYRYPDEEYDRVVLILENREKIRVRGPELIT
eukprot:TRINITY_DN6930_c1_g1_i1.p1 TRINITY_DN6930_c1_g1~~TRINITY_DN6930_c1_g1_i1.p1  ORF type:complete len:166 (-),score=41.10 TRINITY_DN6930_c1_g1_i1:204-635(-)